MKYNQTDKSIAYLTLISGLTISAVAVWYSVAGLVAIFAAAAVPIIIMGVTLEISKLIATVWLKMNWSRAPVLMRTYLLTAIAVLMLITSMGIFGFLSKAHLDQAVPTGDIAAKVAVIEEKIKTERDNVDAARKALAQMDATVDQTIARSSDEKGADKAVALRRSQQRERTNLQNEIATAQKKIAAYNEERAPIAKDLRAVEAEVGPIKYIAALIYGDNPDANLLEKAVTWVIIIIVFVFDPLAVILLLASQYSFQWFRKEREEAELMVAGFVPVTQETVDKIKELVKDVDVDLDKPLPVEEADIEEPRVEDTLPEAEQRHNEYTPSVPMGTHYETVNQDNEDEDEDDVIIDLAVETEKALMKAWKHDHPESSLKHYKRLYKRGLINKLPWDDYHPTKPDVSGEDVDAVVEAAKWAQEQIEKNPSYVQNAEQSEGTLWQRVKKSKEDNV